jgi:hypothetical protein
LFKRLEKSNAVYNKQYISLPKLLLVKKFQQAFLAGFQVLGPSLVGLQQPGCVMFGITGTGLGTTRLFAGEPEPQIWT